MATKISAIISAYYCAQFLEKRIDNLQGQCEIVAVCQKDSAEHKILIDKKVDVIVLTDDIPTIYKAWNLGIKAAHGDYITSANSDDRHYPGMLRKMADVLDKYKSIALVYSDIDTTNEIDGVVTGQFKNRQRDFIDLLTICFVGPMPLWRKSLHDKHGWFDEEYHVAGDYEFWLRIGAADERFFYLPEAVGIYVDRPDSAEHRAPVRTIWETARAKRPYKELIK
jgi:glycosyltransferase involved in cell wall biosynthesis